MKILVVTVSDRAAAGVYEDRSGPAIEKTLKELLPDAEVSRTVVPDESAEIGRALEKGIAVDVILTTGGTGIGPRDVTPEATAQFCKRLVPGIAEMLRAESLKQTPGAALSRGVAGVRGKTLVVNLPGSVRGAEFCARLLGPVLKHAIEMMAGKSH